MADTVSNLLLPRLLDELEPGLSAFAVLDGASIPNLPQALYQHEPDHLCLYRGALEPDLAETAPYLVAIEPNTPFTDWLFNDGWGNHWGIFCNGRCTIRDLRTHFRKFLIVYDPTGKPMYFRFYDPRVMRTFLPTCTFDELRSIFGPIDNFFVEDEDASRCIRFRQGDRILIEEFIAGLPARDAVAT